MKNISYLPGHRTTAEPVGVLLLVLHLSFTSYQGIVHFDFRSISSANFQSRTDKASNPYRIASKDVSRCLLTLCLGWLPVASDDDIYSSVDYVHHTSAYPNMKLNATALRLAWCFPWGLAVPTDQFRNAFPLECGRETLWGDNAPAVANEDTRDITCSQSTIAPRCINRKILSDAYSRGGIATRAITQSCILHTLVCTQKCSLAGKFQPHVCIWIGLSQSSAIVGMFLDRGVMGSLD